MLAYEAPRLENTHDLSIFGNIQSTVTLATTFQRHENPETGTLDTSAAANDRAQRVMQPSCYQTGTRALALAPKFAHIKPVLHRGIVS